MIKIIFKMIYIIIMMKIILKETKIKNNYEMKYNKITNNIDLIMYNTSKIINNNIKK